MITDDIIVHCAPTLAGIKTGNVFSVRETCADIADEIRAVNRALTKKGLRLIPIRKTDSHTLIYLYRPDRLRKDLCEPGAISILSAKGYNCHDPNCCLAQLVRRLNEDKDFPHEIGLFLGYPPYDVSCFMNHPCRGVKCVGCWKVYSDPEEALKTFKKYQKCTEEYKKEVDKGKPLEELVVVEPTMNNDSGIMQ